MQNNTYCIDYCTLTLTAPDYCESATSKLAWFMRIVQDSTMGALREDAFLSVPRAFQFYDMSMKYAGENKFYFSAADGKKNGGTVFLFVSGQGIREIGTLNLNRLLSACCDRGCHCTRLDLAYDDYIQAIPRKKLYTAFGKYLRGIPILESRFKPETVQFYEGVYDNVPYKNIVFGSRNSAQYMRLYDKRAEQGSKDEAVPPYWYRFELELRKDVANGAFHSIFKDGADLQDTFLRYLNRMYRVLAYAPEGSELINKRRVPSAEWWLDFVQTNAKGEALCLPQSRELDLERMISHISKNYSAYLYTLNQVCPDILRGIIQFSGEEKALNPKYQSIIQAYSDIPF